ncbi:metal-dependent transcriptional regulator [Candidatus Bipolaricaulota bacterium]|nr:metal-dependent transcriptional regulator [Candidatus Bipolaricaulota bacterium]MBS3813780.1 metal-dependent transcriptional regulator [Candidatus Bipolaricaulota bacterium]
MDNKSLEDYLEAIYKSLIRRGHAKTNEIAEDLGVKAPSVTEMFDKLKERGYINYRKYEGVTLTEKGSELAKNVSEVHENMKKFLELLQVSSNQADRDACKVEHNLSEESITQLNKFINFVEGCPEDEARWLRHFKYYSEYDEFPSECPGEGK